MARVERQRNVQPLEHPPKYLQPHRGGRGFLPQVTLVIFDTAAVYDKYIGETEKRIRKVFQVAEGLAPCVLWIDELEKVFAGSGPDSASADAGVSSHICRSFTDHLHLRKGMLGLSAHRG